MKKKIVVIFGTRPEAIKLSPVIRELGKSSDLQNFIISTGQHKEMLRQVLDLFEVTPDFDLDIMSSDQTLNSISSKVIKELDILFRQIKPDMVIVHGDTSTAMSAAICAFHLKIPISHIEAGLRSHNVLSPWPEELNRSIISLVASLNFAPTEQAKLNLVNQGVDPLSIKVTGNTVIDALRFVKEKSENQQVLVEHKKKLPLEVEKNYKIVLVTGHRRESFGRGFENICLALKKIASIKNVKVIYPVHLNPSVKEPVERHLSDDPNIILIDPLDYESFIHLMMEAYIILTDSGGIQEEAPFLGKPVLLMRDNTERPEAIDSGCVKMVGTETEKIVNGVVELLESKDQYNDMAKSANPYGDGYASIKIVEKLRAELG